MPRYGPSSSLALLLSAILFSPLLPYATTPPSMDISTFRFRLFFSFHFPLIASFSSTAPLTTQLHHATDYFTPNCQLSINPFFLSCFQNFYDFAKFVPRLLFKSTIHIQSMLVVPFFRLPPSLSNFYFTIFFAENYTPRSSHVKANSLYNLSLFTFFDFSFNSCHVTALRPR